MSERNLKLSWATPTGQVHIDIKGELEKVLGTIVEWHRSEIAGALYFVLGDGTGYVILGAEVKKGMVTVEKLGQEEETEEIEDIEIY